MADVIREESKKMKKQTQKPAAKFNKNSSNYGGVSKKNDCKTGNTATAWKKQKPYKPYDNTGKINKGAHLLDHSVAIDVYTVLFALSCQQRHLVLVLTLHGITLTYISCISRLQVPEEEEETQRQLTRRRRTTSVLIPLENRNTFKKKTTALLARRMDSGI